MQACTCWRGFLGDQLEQWTDTDLHGEAEDEDDAASPSAAARQQFAAQLLTLVLTDRPAIGADTGRGRGGALIIRVIRILLPYLPAEAFLVSCCLRLDTFSVQNLTISAQIYLPI